MMFLLLACATEDRTSLLVDFVTDGTLDAASEWRLLVDPDTPYLGPAGEPLGVDEVDGLENWVPNDPELELAVSVVPDAVGLPTVELRPGGNVQPFSLRLWGWDGVTRTVASDVFGDIHFVSGRVASLTLTTHVLAIPISPCGDGFDNDEDGWTDRQDPDCVEGLEELGFGDAPCNDGIDNDGDSAIDASDPDCRDAEEPSEGE